MVYHRSLSIIQRSFAKHLARFFKRLNMYDIIFAVKFAAMMLAFVLGLSCIVMACISTKQGQEAIRERVEYGFMGVSGVAVSALLLYAIS